MKLKRFVAKDMKSALNLIKEQLGPDAIIMSNKTTDTGVEVVAGIELMQAQTNLAQTKNALQRALELQKQNKEKRLQDKEKASSKEKASNSTHELLDDSVSISKKAVASLESQNNDQKSFAQSLNDILNRQNNISEDNLPDPSKAPKRLSENEHLQALFAKSEQKQEKERQEKENGIESYNVNGSDSIEDVKQEVKAIRQLLQFELAGLIKDNQLRTEPIKAMVKNLLVGSGFDAKICDDICQKISSDASFNFAWRELSGILEEKLVIGNDEIINDGGIVTLIGPAGVGKTTTAAKIAARFVMKYGPDQVALVSADNYRIGAFEQIKTYGRIMGCTSLCVKNLAELPEILYSLKDKSLVIIDTAGVGLSDERFGTLIAQLKLQSKLNLKHYLVLPATAQRKVLMHAYKHFSSIALSGLILTKLDEAQTLGDALSLSIKEAIPIAYITDGQRVPEDLQVPDRHLITIRALSCVEDDITDNIEL